jgi:hypothetical protein
VQNQPIPLHSTNVRQHGPVRARRPVGDLHGPPPSVPRQVRTVKVTIEQLDDGRWRYTMPSAPGWAVVAHNPVTSVQAVRSAFTEAQVVAHATWRGHVYDRGLDQLGGGPEYRRHKPRSRGRRRCDVYDCREWRLTDDGRWLSPRGHKYPEHTQAVQRVVAARLRLGLAGRPDPRNPDVIPPERNPTSLADMPREEAIQTLVASGARR